MTYNRGYSTTCARIAPVILCAGLALALNLGAAVVPEPSTVFYGKILGIGSERPFLLTEGNLTWTIRRADGTSVTLHAALYPENGGMYSYRLDVPHNALAYGLTAISNAVPLAAAETEQVHARIAVDGVPATIIGPGGGAFMVDQARRAATYRLDLAVPLTATDTDGDGLPDWWEDAYGGDKQDAGDAGADPDGDGLTNLSEYLAGTDPGADSRIPSLVTAELTAYADGTTGIRLDAVDVDSRAAELVYRLESLPCCGALLLRNGMVGETNGDLVLQLGDTFTQADVAGGRVVYLHASGGRQDARDGFAVSLRDEDPGHGAVTGAVALVLYRPDASVSADRLDSAIAGLGECIPAPEAIAEGQGQSLVNYLLSRELGYVVWDASSTMNGIVQSVPSSELSAEAYEQGYLPQFGPDRGNVLQGGLGDDTLSGGMADDVLMGGAGDDRLSGCGGQDVFLLTSANDGNDTILDFCLADGDVLDVSRALSGTSTHLEDYLTVTASGTNSVVTIDPDGAGPETATLVVTVIGLELAQADLYDLIDNGTLRVGVRSLAPRVELALASAVASENGPRAAELTLTRRGDAAAAVSINLIITGSAQNGVDYQRVPAQVTLSAGQTAAVIRIMPYVDAITELDEVVDIVVDDGTGYTLGGGTHAVVTIEDLAPQIGVEALEPLAVVDTHRNGVFLIRRAGITDRSVLVRLRVSGGAVAGRDYKALPTYVNLQPNQTTALLEVVPLDSAALDANGEAVQLEIVNDATYVRTENRRAHVLVVREQLSLAEWRSRYFPDATGDWSAFASAHAGGSPVANLARYAFGLDPLNPARTSGRPVSLLRDGCLVVSFRRAATALGVDYIVEASDDLVSWHGGGDYVETVELPELADQPDMTAVRAVRDVGEAPHQYLRVRVVCEP